MATVMDPVCKMVVNPKTTKFKTEYYGQTYYFCSEDCLKEFESNPEKYLSVSKTSTHSKHVEE